MPETRPLSPRASVTYIEPATVPVIAEASTPVPATVEVDKEQQAATRLSESKRREHLFPSASRPAVQPAPDSASDSPSGRATSIAPGDAAATAVLRRRQLGQAHRDLKSARRSLSDVDRITQRLHKLMAGGIGEQNSYAAGALTSEHGQIIREIEGAMRSSPQVKEAIDALLKKVELVEKEHGGLTLREKGQRILVESFDWLKHNLSADMVKVIVATILGPGGGKSLAWYGARKFVSSAEVSFDAVSKMLKLFGQRYAASDLLAMFVEYIPTVYAQDKMRAIGRSMTTWGGGAGLADAGSTIISQNFTGKTTAGEKAQIGVTGFFNVVQTGVLNDLWSAMRGSKVVWEAITLPAHADPASALQHAQEPHPAVASAAPAGMAEAPESVALQELGENEAAQPALPARREDSRAQASKLVHLDKSFPNAGIFQHTMEQHGQRLETAQASMQQALSALGSLNASDESGAAMDEGISVEAGQEMIQDMMTRLQHARQTMSGLVERGDPEQDQEQLSKLDKVLDTLKAASADLQRHGGRDPNTFYLIAGMTAMVAVLGGLGFAGNKVGGALSQIPLRGALITLASGPGQTIGNAASYVFDVKAMSRTLTRFMGMDARRAPAMEGFLKWGMAASIISVFEFPLLVAGITFSDKAADLAGKDPRSVANHPLTVPVVRGLQELYKALAGPTINRFMAGEALHWNHVIGAVGNAATQAVSIGLSIRGSGNKEKID